MSTIADFFNGLTATGITNLQTALTQLGSSGVSTVIGGLTGPSNNAQAIGKLLSRVSEVYATGNLTTLTSIAITAAPLEVGLTSAQTIALNNVWSQVNIPNNQAQVANAIAAAETALGLAA